MSLCECIRESPTSETLRVTFCSPAGQRCSQTQAFGFNCSRSEIDPPLEEVACGLKSHKKGSVYVLDCQITLCCDSAEGRLEQTRSYELRNELEGWRNTRITQSNQKKHMAG